MNDYVLQFSPQVLARMGAALWGMTGQRFQAADLFWAEHLLGPGGQAILTDTLYKEGVLQGGFLDPVRLARWLARQAGDPAEPRLLWTFPTDFPDSAHMGTSYRSVLTELIEAARGELFIVSPYLVEGGIKPVRDLLLAALLRGVAVTVVAHDLFDAASPASGALEDLRREAQRTKARFIAYAAQPNQGLIHAKIVLQDDSAVLLGSANLTGAGYGLNFEAGMVLRGKEVIEVQSVLRRLLKTPLVRLVFKTDNAE